MTAHDKLYAALLLAWSRTLAEHGLTLDEWLRRQKELVKA